MKKTLLLLMMILPMLGYAQPGPLDVNVGLKIGANFNRMAGNTWTGGYRSGILGGAFASVGVKKIGGQIEALISTTTITGKGSSFNNAKLLLNPADSSSSASFGATTLNIPILLNLKIFGNAMLQVGPQYSALLSVKDKDGALNIPAANVFNTSDFGGVLGLQLKLPLKLNAGVRYVFGLSDQNLSSVGETWRQSTIQAHLGFSFL